MQGMHGDDESLHHNAAQVGPHAVLTDVRQAGIACHLLSLQQDVEGFTQCSSWAWQKCVKYFARCSGHS